MNKAFSKYANTVISYLECDEKTRRRIREDVIEMLYERYEESKEEDPKILLGDPYILSKEFEENIPAPKPQKKTYISPMTLFGLPLLYISYSKNITAKGIIAIGYKSIGIISVGAVSVGVISLGALSIGVFAFGGMAIALSAAFGGMAIAYDLALGGLAVAKSLAMGGLAIAKDVAIGGGASAKLIAYNQMNISPDRIGTDKTYAYLLPAGKRDFRLMFDKIFENFGTIKTYIIHKMFN